MSSPTSGGAQPIRYDTTFAIRYETENAVPIADVIASLQGVEAALREAAALVPYFAPGATVEQISVRVGEITQNSPLREMFLVALVVAYQKDLEKEVAPAIEGALGVTFPDSIDTLVTFLTLTILFYGIGAIKTLAMGDPAGPAKHVLDSLVRETAQRTGLSDEQVRDRLDARYGQKKPWARLRTAVKGIFRPSKQQASAPMNLNGLQLDQPTMQDIPADFIVEHVEEIAPSRYFEDVPIELHAQDKDHGGKGWAAVIPAIADRRVPLKLMVGIDAQMLWGADRIRGDVSVIYDRVADGMIPKAIHLHRRLIDHPGPPDTR